MDPFRRGRGQGKSGSLTTGGWADPNDIGEIVHEASKLTPPADQTLRSYSSECVLLGETYDNRKIPVGWLDDRHLVTIAGSRAGKGRCAIIPNLLRYSGSVVCVDPKGENAKLTVEQRAKPISQGGLGQEVYVLDPFNVSGVDKRFIATFNPLWMVKLTDDDALEQISAIADSMIIQTDPKDAHWDETARDLIEGVILHVLTAPEFSTQKSLRTVRRLLTNGWVPPSNSSGAGTAGINFPTSLTPPAPDDPFETLFRAMSLNDAFDGVVSGQGFNLLNMGDEERASVLSTARRNTKFLDGVSMPRALEKSHLNLSMKRFKLSKRGASVYLCLPARYMSTHSRWLRLIINSLMTEFERDPPGKKTRTLAILDEFPMLGHLKKIENAVGFMAGFGLKLWTFLQDINQLRRDYPKSWETFLANAGVCQFFGNADFSTLEYVSKNLGEVEIAPILETMSKVEQLSKGQISDEDFKQAVKQRSPFMRLTLEEEDFEQNTITAGTQTSRSPQLMKTPLMTPDEIYREFSRESQRQLLLASGLRPFYLWRINYDEKDWTKYCKN
jgi:type IV secretion system protein VirD4